MTPDSVNAASVAVARSRAVPPVAPTLRRGTSTPSGITVTWPRRLSSKSSRPSVSSMPAPTGVQPVSIGAMTPHASASVGASRMSDTPIPYAWRASARSRCGLTRVLTAVPSSKATAISTGRGRDIRPSSPTVNIAIAQKRRGPPSSAASCRNRAIRRSVFRSLGSTGRLSTSPFIDVHRLNAT